MRGARVLLAPLVLTVVVPVTVLSWPASAQTPLPTLRGIVLTQSGGGRAYLEDPRTGTVAAYATRDAVGEYRVEEIRADRVVLRRGDELIPVRLGASTETSAPSSPTRRPIAVQSGPGAASGSGAPIVGNGQPWLDRLGIPPRALSRAIEQAPAAPGSDNLDD